MNIWGKLSIVTFLVIAAVQTIRIGCADYFFQEGTAASVRRAIEIWPRDGNFYLRLADIDPPNSISSLRRAVALNPGLSRAWIGLGLRFEFQGDLAQAERCYLDGARHDRQFLPALTLANFYARRNDAHKFWPWARHAVEMSYGDIRPLLRSAFAFTNDPGIVFNRMIVNRRQVEHQFLYYLLEQHLDAPGVVARLVTTAEPEDRPALLAWMNRLLETGRIPEAHGLWNSMSDHKVIPYSHLALITNADFSFEPLQAGFDWQVSAPPGVACDRVPGGLRIEFSGNQPESFGLAAQYVDLSDGAYTLSFEYRTSAIEKTTNLRWRVGAVVSQPLTASESWQRFSWTFTSGPSNRLILTEQREPGTNRPDGVFYIRGLNLTVSGASS